MKITQGYVSKSLEGLDFRAKYGLTEYIDSTAPLVIFGMYRDDDLHCFKHHAGPIVVVWQGSDGRNLTAAWAEALLTRPDAKHYAISHYISGSLTRLGIPHELVPISATTGEGLECTPRGDSIYFYYSDNYNKEYYGADYIPEIERRTGLKVIGATFNSYTRDELPGVYRDCFVGVRMTEYDGCPNTIIELGLMGRRTIFNGNMPFCISWSSIDSVCAAIMDEYNNRHCFNEHIHNAYKEFLNIKLDFLEI